jgi:hypothetical protein
MDYTWAKQLGLVRKPAEFVTSISDERGEELLYAGMPISKTFEVGCVCHATLATPCHDKSPSSPPLIDPHPFHPPLAPLTLLCCAMLCLHLVLSCAGGHWNRWHGRGLTISNSQPHFDSWDNENAAHFRVQSMRAAAFLLAAVVAGASARQSEVRKMPGYTVLENGECVT